MDILKDRIYGIKTHGIDTDAPVTLRGNVSITGSSSVTLTASQITTVDESDTHGVGARGRDSAGNEYVYLKGATGVVAGDWVVFSSEYAVTRLAATQLGSVAVAVSAVNATTKFGWFQIYGEADAKVVATGGVRVYTSSVTGQGLATVATGGLIHGAVTKAGAGNTVTGDLTEVQLNTPFVDRASGSY